MFHIKIGFISVTKKKDVTDNSELKVQVGKNTAGQRIPGLVQSTASLG